MSGQEGAYRRGPWRFVGQDVIRVEHDRAGVLIDGNAMCAFRWNGQSGEGGGCTSEEDGVSVEVTRSENACTIRLIDRGEAELGISFEVVRRSDPQPDGYLMLVPNVGDRVGLSTGDVIPLGLQPFSWTVPGQMGAMEHRGWRLLMQPGARVEWEGADEAQARIAVILPFLPGRDCYEMVLQII